MNDQLAQTFLNLAFSLLAASMQPHGAVPPTGHPHIAQTSPTWHGLVVRPELRCTVYRRGDYPYPQAIERQIAQRLGAIYSPYYGQTFPDLRHTDIEHVVSLSEAHDSGLCAASPAVKRTFAADLANLTLADPHLNRNLKAGHDAARWQPQRSRCWFAQTVVAVKRHYALSVDRSEARALEGILRTCPPHPVSPQPPLPMNTTTPPAVQWALRSCAEARAHGIAPVPAHSAAYTVMQDRDRDGIACE